MLILILTDVQYLQNVIFGFEEGSNGQNHSWSNSHQMIKNSLPPAGGIPLPLNTIWKTLYDI